MDTRKALGDGSGQPSGDDDMYIGGGKNRLPGPYPYDRIDLPESAPTEGGNPAMTSRRPIADMEANLDGTGSIETGVAFRVPMCEHNDKPNY